LSLSIIKISEKIDRQRQEVDRHIEQRKMNNPKSGPSGGEVHRIGFTLTKENHFVVMESWDKFRDPYGGEEIDSEEEAKTL
jgi:hypothetical protein